MTSEANSENQERRPPRFRVLFWLVTALALIVVFRLVRAAPKVSNPVFGWMLPVLTSAIWLAYYRIHDRMTRFAEASDAQGSNILLSLQEALDALAITVFITLMSFLSAWH